MNDPTAFGMFGHPAPVTPNHSDNCKQTSCTLSTLPIRVSSPVIATSDLDTFSTRPGEYCFAVWISPHRTGFRHLTGMSIAKLTRATAMVTPAEGPSWRSQGSQTIPTPSDAPGERCSHRSPLEWLPRGRSSESAPERHVNFQDTSSHIWLGRGQLTDYWHMNVHNWSVRVSTWFKQCLNMLRTCLNDVHALSRNDFCGSNLALSSHAAQLTACSSNYGWVM